LIEIERKFLVAGDGWPSGQRQIRIRQGYMVNDQGMVVRVRQKDEAYYLSLKARINLSSSYDFEYAIPAEEAETMFEHLCGGRVISKTRHEVMHAGMRWEVDQFHDENQGLVVAEIELPDEQYQLDLPDWVKDEVTSDTRYRNSVLVLKPYSQW
jgi:CYTH domain-containing protein